MLTGAALQVTAGLVVLLRQGMAAFRVQRRASSAPPQAALVPVLVNMILPPHVEVSR